MEESEGGKVRLGGPEDDARVVVGDVLLKCPTNARQRCLDLLVSNDGIHLGVDVLYALGRRWDTPEWLDDFAAEVNSRMPSVLREKFEESIANLDYGEFGIFTTWGLVGFYDQARDFANENIESGAWRFTDYLARLTGTMVMIGASGPIMRLGQLDVAWIEKFYGVDAAIEKAGALLDQEFEPLRRYEEMPLDDSTRTSYALAFLKEQRRLRQSTVTRPEIE